MNRPRRVNTGQFILSGDCPFVYSDITSVFMCANINRLFVSLRDGRIYEQEYYDDVPQIHWFLLPNNRDKTHLERSKIAVLRKDRLFMHNSG